MARSESGTGRKNQGGQQRGRQSRTQGASGAGDETGKTPARARKATKGEQGKTRKHSGEE